MARHKKENKKTNEFKEIFNFKSSRLLIKPAESITFFSDNPKAQPYLTKLISPKKEYCMFYLTPEEVENLKVDINKNVAEIVKAQLVHDNLNSLKLNSLPGVKLEDLLSTLQSEINPVKDRSVVLSPIREEDC